MVEPIEFAGQITLRDASGRSSTGKGLVVVAGALGRAAIAVRWKRAFGAVRTETILLPAIRRARIGIDSGVLELENGSTVTLNGSESILMVDLVQRHLAAVGRHDGPTALNQLVDMLDGGFDPLDPDTWEPYKEL